MTTLLEDPLPIVLIGILLEAMLSIAWVNTRRRGLLVAMLAVLLLVAGGVGVEWWVVTDAERIEDALIGAAQALEADDLAAFDQYLAGSATRTRSRAAYALGLVEIDRFRITHLDIALNRLTSPPTAQARFFGAVHYRGRAEAISYGIYRAEFTVTLQLDNGRWLITDHVEHDELP
jgi:hypothetical protein